MAQFSANPSNKHMNAAKHILRYLNMTQSVSIIDNGGSNKGLIAFMDSDWASDKIKHRSQTGFFFMIAGTIFLWQSGIKFLLNKLDINVGPIHINSDNQGSLFIGSNPVQEK